MIIEFECEMQLFFQNIGTTFEQTADIIDKQNLHYSIWMMNWHILCLPFRHCHFFTVASGVEKPWTQDIQNFEFSELATLFYINDIKAYICNNYVQYHQKFQNLVHLHHRLDASENIVQLVTPNSTSIYKPQWRQTMHLKLHNQTKGIPTQWPAKGARLTN